MTQSCTPSVTSCRPLPLSSTYLERHSWCGPWYLPWQGLKSKPSDTKKLVPGNDVLLSKWRHRFGYSNHLIVFASGLFPYPSIHYPTFRNDLRAGRPGKFRWFEAVVELWKHRSISQSIRLHHVRIPESRLGASQISWYHNRSSSAWHRPRARFTNRAARESAGPSWPLCPQRRAWDHSCIERALTPTVHISNVHQES